MSFYFTPLWNIFLHPKSTDPVLVDCSKYYGVDRLFISEGTWGDYVDLDLKTYINCVQAQTVKMQTKIAEMQSQIDKLSKGKNFIDIMYFKLHN